MAVTCYGYDETQQKTNKSSSISFNREYEMNSTIRIAQRRSTHIHLRLKQGVEKWLGMVWDTQKFLNIFIEGMVRENRIIAGDPRNSWIKELV